METPSFCSPKPWKTDAITGVNLTNILLTLLWSLYKEYRTSFICTIKRFSFFLFKLSIIVLFTLISSELK